MQYLFQVSIGPVQSFIASARRTRDLWFGSWLLSELSKAAAKKISDTCGLDSLIFPAPVEKKLLEENSDLNVANKIVALIDKPPDEVGRKVLEAIKGQIIKDQVIKGQVIKGRLETITDLALGPLGNIKEFNKTAAYAQIEDLVEYLWVALPFDGTDYPTTRKNLEALMAARKNTRDFRTVSWGSNARKSSLDGQLECVISEELYRRRKNPTDEQERIKTLYYQYSVGPTERLSGVDLLKRRGNASGESHFPSTSHIAALPFLKRLAYMEDPEPARKMFFAYIEKIKEIAKSQKQVVMLDTIPNRYNYWEHSILDTYDGSLFFEERLVDIISDPTGFEPAKEVLRAFYKHVDETLGKARPIPYYAILQADGDFMGQTIDEQSRYAKGAEKHREISRKLDSFATDARKIIEEHLGAPIYTGGDDILAFMPLHTVLACAQKLNEEFATRLKSFTYGNNKSPTLSVGIAIVHHLELLREALNLARSAEKQAKGVTGKNALAIRVSKRSGEESAVVGKWGELNERLATLTQYYRDADIPHGTSYELRDLAKRLGGAMDIDKLPEAMLTDAKRILQRKLSIRQKTRTQRSTTEPDQILETLLAMLSEEEQKEQNYPDATQTTRVRVRVMELSTELIVARFFADAIDLAEPQKKGAV